MVLGCFLSLRGTSGASAPEEVSLCDGFLFRGFAGTVRAHPLYFTAWPKWEDIWDAFPTSLLELGFFGRKTYSVVPVMSVEALLVDTNYLSGDLLVGGVGQSLVVVTVGEDIAPLGYGLWGTFVKEPGLLSRNQEAIKHERSKHCGKGASGGHLRIRACPLGVGKRWISAPLGI